jgi:hypothetical protein
MLLNWDLMSKARTLREGGKKGGLNGINDNIYSVDEKMESG